MVLEKTTISNGGNHHHGEDANLKPMKIPVVIGKLPRTELPIAVGLIRAEDLIPRASIAHREFEGGKGYQRLPSKLRVNLLAQSLIRQKVDLPTALLLNLRTYDPSVNLLKDDEGASFLSLTNELLWEVDGQHRCEGLKAALDENPDRFRDYTIPFVVGLGWSEDYEMEQFFVVNSECQKRPHYHRLRHFGRDGSNHPWINARLGGIWKRMASSRARNSKSVGGNKPDMEG